MEGRLRQVEERVPMGSAKVKAVFGSGKKKVAGCEVRGPGGGAGRGPGGVEGPASGATKQPGADRPIHHYWLGTVSAQCISCRPPALGICSRCRVPDLPDSTPTELHVRSRFSPLINQVCDHTLSCALLWPPQSLPRTCLSCVRPLPHVLFLSSLPPPPNPRFLRASCSRAARSRSRGTRRWCSREHLHPSGGWQQPGSGVAGGKEGTGSGVRAGGCREGEGGAGAPGGGLY